MGNKVRQKSSTSQQHLANHEVEDSAVSEVSEVDLGVKAQLHLELLPAGRLK
jgi:hypothetical protein